MDVMMSGSEAILRLCATQPICLRGLFYVFFGALTHYGAEVHGVGSW
jgi:hypothetical protein